MAAELDNSSSFMRKDGPYSFIVLITIAVNVIFLPGFAMSSVGVFADIYPARRSSIHRSLLKKPRKSLKGLRKAVYY